MNCLLRSKAIALFLGTLFFAAPAYSTQWDPWFSELYLPIFRTNYTFERFHKVATGTGLKPYTAYNSFVDIDLEMTAPENWNFQLELVGASTRNTRFGFESFRATARYLILNDVGGESPVSLAAGATITFPWRYRLHDISLIHHSLYDTEVHLSVGKEVPCGQYWAERYWMLVGIGQGTRGSPWVHAIAAAEKNIRDIHQFRISLDYLRGLGSHSITSVKFFHGYASIAHQSLDLIFRYVFSIPAYFDINMEYLQRLSAKNCPQGVQAATIGIILPFSID